MPLITPPSLQGIGIQDDKGKSLHVVTLAYKFSGDAPVQVQLGALGLSVDGTSYVFDPASLSNAGLGSIKSIGFSASFGSSSGTDVEDGALFFYSQASQQLITLSPGPMPNAFLPAADVPPGSAAQPVKTMSGVISLVSHKISKLIIAKAVNQPSDALFGDVFLSLYDFVVPPYITSGYGSGIPI